MPPKGANDALALTFAITTLAAAASSSDLAVDVTTVAPENEKQAPLPRSEAVALLNDRHDVGDTPAPGDSTQLTLAGEVADSIPFLGILQDAKVVDSEINSTRTRLSADALAAEARDRAERADPWNVAGRGELLSVHRIHSWDP